MPYAAHRAVAARAADSKWMLVYEHPKFKFQGAGPRWDSESATVTPVVVTVDFDGDGVCTAGPLAGCGTEYWLVPYTCSVRAELRLGLDRAGSPVGCGYPGLGLPGPYTNLNQKNKRSFHQRAPTP